MNSTTKHTYLKEFRERYFEAKFDSKMKYIGSSASVYRDTYKNDSKATVNLIKSLHIMAHVLNEVDTNDSSYRLSAALKTDHVKFEFLNEELRFSSFRHLPEGEKFDIHKFKAIGNHSGDFFKIGEYATLRVLDNGDRTEINGTLNINYTHFKYSKDYPKRTCSKQCSAGNFMKVEIVQCCWECVACDDFEVSNGSITSCTKCSSGTVPDQNKSACISISQILTLPIKWNDSQNLISIGISSFSITLTAIVIWVFVKYQNTPAVKSTTRELCYVMFAGIILVNLTLSISAMTSNFKTPDGKILPAVGFTMIYAALLVKTNRIARLLVTSKHKFANMNLKYVSLKAQVSITSILIGIEILICWFAVKFHDPDPNIRGSDLVLRMFYLDSIFFIKIFAFVALLILFCTYYAFKTRNLPENFNETKCIGFAMYATVVTAVAFSMVYFATDTSNKILAMNLCASINTLTILIFLFAPKLYIILWKPERNTRVYFSPVTSSIRSYIGKESRPNACKPLNQCYSLETSGPQSSSTDAVESVKENERNVIEKVIKGIDFQQKILNLDTLKEKVKTGDLQLDEMIDDLQKEYFEKIEKVKLKYNVDVNRVEQNEIK
ncbi:metabotropic glutamate receptor 1-like isoform X2 [Planococcus citri]|uniref:metabotropic glutamate receptor 1-like isoform X2 n=1 Tax=Planococcus citri TaxID=170843 RepID=UPI0031F7BB35